MSKTRPKIAAIVPSTIASCQIGVLKPLSALARQDEIQLKTWLETKAPINAIHWADMVVFCRNTEPAYGHLLSEAVSTNKPIVFDLDDNFWDVPFETDPELARYHRLPLRLQQLEKYLAQADLVRVYSPVMEEHVKVFNPNVRLLKAGFDFNLIAGGHRAMHVAGQTNIVYATSRIVDNQYLLFKEAMLKIVHEYGDKVQFTIWGCQPPELVGVRGLKFIPLTPDYESFLRQFARSNFDIGLAPMEDTQFHRSKTNTKLRDYGACKIAGVYSDISVYSSCVEHEKTGLLVKNTTESWYEGMRRLIEDTALRASIQKNAYDHVQAQYRQEVAEAEWLAQINELLARNTNYSIHSGPVPAKISEILIRSDFHGLSGIEFPAISPGDNEPVGKVALEILTPSRNVVREASSTKPLLASGGSARMAFTFTPIHNSKEQEFLLRFISLPEESQDGASNWFPTAAYIQMLYSHESKC